MLTHPAALYGAKSLRARIRRPGLPETEREITWPAQERVEIQPTHRLVAPTSLVQVGERVVSTATHLVTLHVTSDRTPMVTFTLTAAAAGQDDDAADLAGAVKAAADLFEEKKRFSRQAVIEMLQAKDHGRPACEAALKQLVDLSVIRGPLERQEKQKGEPGALVLSGSCRYFRLGLFPIAADGTRWFGHNSDTNNSFDQPNPPHLYDSTRHTCDYALMATPSKTECGNANPSGRRYALAFSLVVASIRA